MTHRISQEEEVDTQRETDGFTSLWYWEGQNWVTLASRKTLRHPLGPLFPSLTAYEVAGGEDRELHSPRGWRAEAKESASS